MLVIVGFFFFCAFLLVVFLLKCLYSFYKYLELVVLLHLLFLLPFEVLMITFLHDFLSF